MKSSAIRRAVLAVLVLGNMVAAGVWVKQAQAEQKANLPCRNDSHNPSEHCKCNWGTGYCTHNGLPFEKPCDTAGALCPVE